MFYKWLTMLLIYDFHVAVDYHSLHLELCLANLATYISPFSISSQIFLKQWGTEHKKVFLT